MDGTTLTKEYFLNDVKDHKLTIIKEDELYRHIRCSREESSTMFFDIITWPGNLAYTGDMGSFMFSRIKDMFTLFRNNELKINTDYWAEAVIAESIYGNGIKEFSVNAFRENILDYTKQHLELSEKEKIPEEVMNELNCLLCAEDEWSCIEEMRNFASEKIEFYDFWEYSSDRKTWHYVWCLYAIVWAISEYDKAKKLLK